MCAVVTTTWITHLQDLPEDRANNERQDSHRRRYTRNIQVLGTILREGGYQLNVAQNGQQALDSVARAKPDLILLDIMMPVMDGFETC